MYVVGNASFPLVVVSRLRSEVKTRGTGLEQDRAPRKEEAWAVRCLYIGFYKTIPTAVAASPGMDVVKALTGDPVNCFTAAVKSLRRRRSLPTYT